MPSILASDDEVDMGNYSTERSSASAGTGSNGSRHVTQGERTHVDIGGWFPFISPITLGVVCACSLAVVLLCGVSLLLIWKRRRRQKLLSDLSFDGSDESKIIKSAPASRIASPKLSKQKSCPEMSCSMSLRNTFGHQVTSDRVSKLILPPEHIHHGDSHKNNKADFSFSAHQIKDEIAPITADHCHDQSISKDNEPHLKEAPCLWFSIVYDGATEHLLVNLVKAENLPGRNTKNNPPDPFVKIFLMPDDKICRVSKVKKSTLTPVFNETHTFKVTAEDVKKRILRFSVYDVDKRRVRHSLGHVVIRLKDLDLTKGDIMWRKLRPVIQSTSIGELQFSLIYIPFFEKIKIAIFNAKNLICNDYPKMGAYVRVQLFYGHKFHSLKSTVVHQGEAEITFNESLSFTVNGKLLDTCNMKISIMIAPINSSAANEVEYGRIIVGPFMFAREGELVHWQKMLSQPALAITQWHSLTSTTSSP